MDVHKEANMEKICTGCFYSHFPQPNMKECKLKSKKLKKNHGYPFRLRGGAGNASDSLIQKAIANAKAHDINLRADEMTVGDGENFSSISLI